MQGLASVLVVTVGIFSGVILGVVLGFVTAEHKGVMAGLRLTHCTTFYRWLALPIRAFGLRHRVMYSLLVLGCLVVFFALCALPVIIAAQFAAPNMLKAATILFVGVAYVSRALGSSLWKRSIGRAA